MSEGVRTARETMDRLYSPGGCPWDAEQTHASLVPYLLEECHELVEAVEAGTRDDVVEELGDVLLQVLFHARLGEDEDDPYDLDTVAMSLVEKLRRRHPHVFAGEEVDVASLHGRWEQLKRQEKPDRTSVLDGIPPSLPALARAQKVVRKGQRIGAPVAPVHAVGAAQPTDGKTGATGPGTDAAAIGAELLRLVALAESQGIDAESALRSQLRLAEAAVRQAEVDRLGAAAGRPQAHESTTGDSTA